MSHRPSGRMEEYSDLWQINSQVEYTLECCEKLIEIRVVKREAITPPDQGAGGSPARYNAKHISKKGSMLGSLSWEDPTSELGITRTK